MEVGSRVEEDKAVRRELRHVGNSGVHCWVGMVKGGAPSTSMADDVPLPTWGDGPVDRVQDAKQVVEGVETDVEALCGATSGRAQHPLLHPRCSNNSSFSADATVEVEQQLVQEPPRVLVAPCQGRQRRDVTLLAPTA